MAWANPGSTGSRDRVLRSRPRRLGDDDASTDDATDPEEYAPEFPRADRDGRADEADVVEQDTEVPTDDEDGDA